jgi:hypothetical protein
MNKNPGNYREYLIVIVFAALLIPAYRSTENLITNGTFGTDRADLTAFVRGLVSNCNGSKADEYPSTVDRFHCPMSEGAGHAQ